jgi:hypothetical protein
VTRLSDAEALEVLEELAHQDETDRERASREFCAFIEHFYGERLGDPIFRRSIVAWGRKTGRTIRFPIFESHKPRGES